VAYTVVFLWISATAAQEPAPPPVPPPSAYIDVLRDFGAARGLTFVGVAAGRKGTPAPLARAAGNDDALGDRIESELEQARTSLSALEEGAALERLGRVEAELLAHPYLPQASFLMAECLALRAQAARSSDPALARQLEARRAAIEGPRALAFGESALSGASPPPGSTEPVPRTEAEPALAIRGLATGDLVEMDGRAALPAQALRAAPGLHHFRIWRAGAPVFATFAEVEVGKPALALKPPPLLACDDADLFAARGGDVPPGISCPSWARVRVEGTGIGVSLCQRSSCGAFVHWQRREPESFTPLDVERGLPAWAGFTIAGATAALVTGLVLWQSGALDRGERAATTLEYTGYRPQGLRF
jgi:hypothetical protein